MRPNRKEPESAVFWFQSLFACCNPHYGFQHVGRMAASYIREQGLFLVDLPHNLGHIMGA
jgi:hypothetical protein